MYTNGFYFTYNPIKREFLKKRRINYFVEGTHNRTNKKFWTYIRDSKLDQALKEWRNYQEKRFEN